MLFIINNKIIKLGNKETTYKITKNKKHQTQIRIDNKEHHIYSCTNITPNEQNSNLNMLLLGQIK